MLFRKKLPFALALDLYNSIFLQCWVVSHCWSAPSKGPAQLLLPSLRQPGHPQQLPLCVPPVLCCTCVLKPPSYSWSALQTLVRGGESLQVPAEDVECRAQRLYHPFSSWRPQIYPACGHTPACLGDLLHHAGAWACAPAFEVSCF